jgi:AcrR family transcriptional regulator
MARHRGEDYEARRQQILDAALAVFARKGFTKATNSEIARAAGIKSPGLIYHYFRDKRDLLDQVMQHRMPILQLVSAPEELGKLVPRELLTKFARSFLSALEQPEACAFIRVMFGEALRSSEFGEMYGRLGPMKAIEFLSGYLRTQMEGGLLRHADPAAAARCFLGPLIVYVLSREVLHLPDAAGLSGDAMADHCVEIFLSGLQANNNGSS